MRSEVTTKRVMALKTAQIKVNPDDGSMSHLLSIECVLEPGDLERIALMFKQRLPIDLTLTSPQSRMDLMVEVLREEQPESTGPVDPVTLAELRVGAKTAIRTAVNAESLAEKGDDSDREVANASEDAAANAIARAAEAAGVDEVEMSVALKEEIKLDILNEDMINEGEHQADEQAAEERAAPDGHDPEALGRLLHEHAEQSEADAETGGNDTGTGAEVPAKPKRQRKARQEA